MIITVFTPCHNQAEHLQEAIDSVLEQSFEDFEYLLYDDGSTDNTLSIMQAAAKKDNRVRVVSLPKQPNVGWVINHSVEEALGDYWVWCPADDLLNHHLLMRKLCLSARHPEDVFYDNWNVIDDSGNKLSTIHVRRMSPEEFSEEVWHSSPIGFTGIWIPTVLLRAIPFPTHLQYSEDFYWMIKATIHHVKFRGVQEILHLKRKHANTNTHRNIGAILDQIPVIRKELREYREKLRVNT